MHTAALLKVLVEGGCQLSTLQVRDTHAQGKLAGLQYNGVLCLSSPRPEGNHAKHSTLSPEPDDHSHWPLKPEGPSDAVGVALTHPRPAPGRHLHSSHGKPC